MTATQAAAPRLGTLTIDALSLHLSGLKVLNDVSAVIHSGETVGLLGPNGAGKSSLIAMIAGAGRPSRGRVLLDGRDVTRLPADRRARIGIRRTFQITQPFATLTTLENVLVGAIAPGARWADLLLNAEDALLKVGLQDKMHHLAATLSTGQRKRLELARALVSRPGVLLLDEVAGGVDRRNLPGLIDLVAAIKQTGITIVLVEHNMGFVRALTDRVIFLDRGSVVADGPTRTVLEDPHIVSLYLGTAAAAAHA